MAGENSRVERSPSGNARNVSFSRRRANLFRMANELCTLCAVKIAIVLFSPGGKAYCFGHPSVDAVIDRFRYSNLTFDHDKEWSDLTEEDEAEKKRQKELKRKVQEFRTDHPGAAPIDSLSSEDLLSMKRALEALEEAFNQQKRELSSEAGPSSLVTEDGATDEAVLSSGEGNGD